MRSRNDAPPVSPSHSTLPESGKKIPVIIRIVVVLPAPLRPRRPVMVPRRTVNEIPSTARTSPNVFLTSRTARISPIGLPLAPWPPQRRDQSAGYCTGEREKGSGFGVRRTRLILEDPDIREPLELLEDFRNLCANAEAVSETITARCGSRPNRSKA